MKCKLILVLILFTLSTKSQKYYEINLAKSLDENTIGLKYTGVIIINKCPGKTYKSKLIVEKELSKSEEEDASSAVDEWKDKLKDLATAYNNLLVAEKESEVPDLIKKLEEEYKKVKSDDPNYEVAGSDKQALINSTRDTLDFSFDLEKNTNIFITIARMKEDKPELSWLQVLRTPRTSSYITHYGFTYSTNIIKEPINYFSKESGKNSAGTDSFTIKPLNPNGKDFWKDLSLTANFLIPIHFNNNPNLSNVNFAWNVGFGVGGDAKFTVFTGPAVLLNDFTALGIGFGVSNSYKLKGEYEPGQGLKENLSFDQLHTRGIRPNVLFTLSLRLSKKQLQGEQIENKGGQ